MLLKRGAPLQKPTTAQINYGAALARGLVGAYFFTEGGGAVVHNAVGSGTDMALQAAPPWGASLDGLAVTFATSGSKYGLIPASTTWSFGTGPFSVVVRARLTAAPSVNENFVRHDSTLGGASGYWRLGIGTGGVINWDINTGGPGSINGATALTNGGFYTMIGTRGTSGASKIYLNGLLDGSGTMSNTATNASEGIWIATLGGSTQFADAAYTLVLIYNRELSASEAQELHTNPWSLLAPVAHPFLMVTAPTAAPSADSWLPRTNQPYPYAARSPNVGWDAQDPAAMTQPENVGVKWMHDWPQPYPAVRYPVATGISLRDPSYFPARQINLADFGEMWPQPYPRVRYPVAVGVTVTDPRVRTVAPPIPHLPTNLPPRPARQWTYTYPASFLDLRAHATPTPPGVAFLSITDQAVYNAAGGDIGAFGLDQTDSAAYNVYISDEG